MPISVKTFGTLPDGREAKLYTLEGPKGLTLEATDYGCRIHRLWVADKLGNPGDVVLGHRTLPEYFGANFQGAAVGRYANRIGNALFHLEGKAYPLAKNDGENSLHGGPGGFHQVLWQAKTQDGEEPQITFSAESPEGEEGFPGRLSVTVAYTLTRDGALRMEYSGTADKPTPFNPTNHSFFNLSGNPQAKIFDTTLQIHAGQVTEVTDDLIPTGTLLPVQGGPLDFTSPKPLGQDMFADDHLIQVCGGFDHNFCVDGEGFRKLAEAFEPESGRVMEVWSDMPGVQLYTFNKVPEPLTGKDGKAMEPHTAFCLETQFYPDSPNQPGFPFAFLTPGKAFATKTEYRFSIR
ncbi:aldose epimerase family protein [Oscillospiraceae bacterium 21-37]